jgi:hypothetical protein
MSDLENKHAKPAMKDMIVSGASQSILPHGTTAISLFAFKTAVIADHMHPTRKPFFSPVARSRFRTSLEIPRGVRVWIGSLRSRQGVRAILRARYLKKNLRPVKGFEFYAVTFALRHLILQVLACKRLRPNFLPADFPMLQEPIGWIQARATAEIWPSDGLPVLWPRRDMGDDVLDAFCDRWGSQVHVRM